MRMKLKVSRQTQYTDDILNFEITKETVYKYLLFFFLILLEVANGKPGVYSKKHYDFY